MKECAGYKRVNKDATENNAVKRIGRYDVVPIAFLLVLPSPADDGKTAYPVNKVAECIERLADDGAHIRLLAEKGADAFFSVKALPYIFVGKYIVQKPNAKAEQKYAAHERYRPLAGKVENIEAYPVGHVLYLYRFRKVW